MFSLFSIRGLLYPPVRPPITMIHQGMWCLMRGKIIGSIVFGRCMFQKAGCKGRATCTSVDVICTEHNHLPDQSSNKANELTSKLSWSHDTEPYLWNCTFISGANFFIQRNMGDVRDDRDSCEVVFLSFPHLMSHPAAVSAVTVLAVLTEHWGFPLTLVTDVFNRGLFHLKLLHA